MKWFAAVLLGAAIALISVTSAGAQAPPNAQAFEEEGKVAGVAPGGLQLLTDQNQPWLVQIVPLKTAVKITGTAEPGYLRPGVCVKFAAAVDAKGNLTEELKELEIYTPSGKVKFGTFPTGSDENAKPIGKLTDGTYDFRGKVVVYRDGELTVVAGKKITGKVAPDAKIAVNVSDLSFAQPDDEVRVRGWERSRPNGPQPGIAIGSEVEIALSKPLAGVPQKGGNRPAKPGKNKEPEAPAVNVDDPFNLGGGKKAGEKK